MQKVVKVFSVFVLPERLQMKSQPTTKKSGKVKQADKKTIFFFLNMMMIILCLKLSQITKQKRTRRLGRKQRGDCGFLEHTSAPSSNF